MYKKIIKALFEAQANSGIQSVPKNWKLNSDGSYNVAGAVGPNDLKNFIKDGNLTIKFNHVTRSFDCRNLKLTSLEGCPKRVDGYFNCSRNNLTSLKGGPEKVVEQYDCRDNKLTSLEGAPECIYSDFICNNNRLTSLKDAPKRVDGFFFCDSNNLITLNGCPKIIGKGFSCLSNRGKRFTMDEIERFFRSNAVRLRTLYSIFV